MEFADLTVDDDGGGNILIAILIADCRTLALLACRNGLGS
jgi:hypothetical protein